MFNGLETSMNTKVWKPTGVPTIYRMIERLDSDVLYNLDLVVTSKNNDYKWIFGLVKKVNIVGLTSVVTILHSFGYRYGKFGALL